MKSGVVEFHHPRLLFLFSTYGARTMNHLLNVLTKLSDLRQQFVTPSERGAAMVEYALLVALVAVIVITAATTLGDSTSEVFSDSTLRDGLNSQ